MRKKWLGILMAGLAVVAIAQDSKVTFKNEPKLGAVNKLAVTIAMQLSGLEAKVAGKMKQTIKSVDQDVVSWSEEWSDFSVEVGGEKMDAQTLTAEVKAKADGDLVSATAGVEGTDGVRQLLVSHFVPPATPIGKDEKYTVEFKANGDVPARKYEGTYLGTEKEGTEDLHKFLINLTVPGETMKAEMTVWVRTDGTVRKLDSKFSDLPIPVAGASASGTLSLRPTE
jgi:hypothetical protein